MQTHLFSFFCHRGETFTHPENECRNKTKKSSAKKEQILQAVDKSVHTLKTNARNFHNQILKKCHKVSFMHGKFWLVLGSKDGVLNKSYAQALLSAGNTTVHNTQGLEVKCQGPQLASRKAIFHGNKNKTPHCMGFLSRPTNAAYIMTSFYPTNFRCYKITK